MLLAKLLGHTRDKWARCVLSIRRRQMSEPGLVDFIELVKDETLLVNDPLFSKSATDQYCEKPSKDSQQNCKHKRNKLTISVAMTDSCKTAGLELCVASQKKHPLDKCESIMEKPLNKRIKILRKGKLCYRCPKPMAKDHNTKNCQQGLTCRICAACHLTIHHSYVPKVTTDSSQSIANSECSSGNTAKEENVTCASVNGKFDVEVISMCVVPIKISHQNCKKTIRTYAMLDNCSQGSFIKQDLLKRLGVDGQKLSLNLKTLTGEKSEETLMVDNLKVAGVNKMNNDWISLPKVYSKKTLPVEKEEVVTPEKVSKWKYLDSIKSEITQTDDIEIGMLIGANCMKALEPLKIIPSKDGDLYAYQTKLG